jgi:hypothetical protein
MDMAEWLCGLLLESGNHINTKEQTDVFVYETSIQVKGIRTGNEREFRLRLKYAKQNDAWRLTKVEE